MRARLGPRDRGISLVEMVVAVLVLSIGVIAGFQSLSQARRGIGEALPQHFAHQVALNRAQEYQILGAAAAASLPAEVALGGITWTLTTQTAPTQGGAVEARIRASAADHPGALLVVYAPVEPPQ